MTREENIKERLINFSTLLCEISSTIGGTTFTIHSPEKYCSLFHGSIWPESLDPADWRVFCFEPGIFEFCDRKGITISSITEQNPIAVARWIEKNVKTLNKENEQL